MTRPLEGRKTGGWSWSSNSSKVRNQLLNLLEEGPECQWRKVIHKKGPPEVMQWQEWLVPDPGPRDVRVRHTAIGVNFADTYHRGGISHPWPVPDGPCVIGFEAVGIVEETGSEVTEFSSGDRVAYGIPPLGSYSEVRNYSG